MSDATSPNPEQRLSSRCKPRGKVRVTCHATAPGPNLARALLEVSTTGLRLLLRKCPDLGTQVLLTIQRLNHLAPVHRLGLVRWVVERDQGGCVVGIELAEPLHDDAVNRLCRGK